MQKILGKSFFGLHLHLARKFSENPKSARGPAQYKSGRGNHSPLSSVNSSALSANVA